MVKNMTTYEVPRDEITLSTLSDLEKYDQWVCFTKDKQPYTPGTNAPAKANDPTTWKSYNAAYTAYNRSNGRYAGVGYELLQSQNLVCTDLDKCIDESGNLSDYARYVVKLLNSYTEVSPSGRGLHIWTRGTLTRNVGPDPQGLSKIEMYDRLRYLTITKNHFPGTPKTIEARYTELDNLYTEVLEERNRNKPAPRALASLRMVKSGNDSAYGLKALEQECTVMANAPDGARNSTLNTVAFRLGQLVGGQELARSTVENQLAIAAERSGLDSREIEKTLQSGLEAGIRDPRTRPVSDEIYGTPETKGKDGGTPGDPDTQFILECLKENEYGDSKLFAKLFRGRVVYDHTSESWYIWNAHYWIEDEMRRVKHLVSGKLASAYLKACASLNLQASQQEATAELSGDEEEQNAAKSRIGVIKRQIRDLTERAFNLRQVARCNNVLNFASGHNGMGITSDRWDKNPWLLALPDGVIDLHTGDFRDGKPEDYIKTISPTTWKGLNAPAPRWEQFLEEIFADREEKKREDLIAFLQRLLGYGITGIVSEHIFSVFYGEDGRNGKDTIAQAITRALGAASCVIQKDVLLEAGRGHSAGAPTPHLSDLKGRRIAWASEPEKGARFNIGQIKELSGGGDIPTRGLHEKKITKLKPSHLLILLTNHKPHADANDSAFWDRMRFITFNMRFVDNPIEPNERKKDTTLWVTLEQETPGILAWLVRGCLEWQKQGLNTPQSVLDDGNKYREEEDTLKTFLDECCIIKSDARVKASMLFETYDTWARDGNLKPMNKTVFGLQMGKKKFDKKKDMNGIFYQGIGILSQDMNTTMNSSKNYSYTPATASQATLEGTDKEDYEQYEQFQQVYSKNTLHEGPISENVVKTIHTIHTIHKEDTINQLVEPAQGSMNSSSPSLETIHTAIIPLVSDSDMGVYDIEDL